jgi:hypothetical protein
MWIGRGGWVRSTLVATGALRIGGVAVGGRRGRGEAQRDSADGRLVLPVAGAVSGCAGGGHGYRDGASHSLGRQVVAVALAMSVVESVTAEIGRMPKDIGESALASLALACAENIDAARPGSTPGAMWAQRLQDVLKELRGLAPPAKTNDTVDQLAEARTRRRSAPKTRGRSARKNVGG